ncbi:MAG TPA: rod shape-determining protein MreD [Lachnospiraceae bacterium]|nr:rod shape-determining protein MreD [Lachnospiraceae bacterium]
MRRKLVMLLLGLAAFLAQTTVSRIIPFSFIMPNMLLMIVVIFAFMRGRRAGMILGFICGLSVDLLSCPVIGFTSLVYVLIGYISGCCYNIFFDEDIKVPVILVGLSDLIYRGCYYVFQFLMLNRISLRSYFIYTVLPELISTIILTFLLYKVMFMIDKKLSEFELEEQQSPWLRK